jgi:hypothetical protein
MRLLAGSLLVGIAVALPAAPARGETAGAAATLVYAVLPVTPEQARELATLVQSPGTIALDLVEVTGAVADAVPTLPAALLHDVLTTPVRDWHLLRGLVNDTVDLVTRPPGAPRSLFRHTIGALHRSQLFTATASMVRRVTQPTNRTARLAIVLTARAHGLPAQDGHLDAIRRAIDRDDPDLGPLLLAAVEGLAQMHGRDAVRLLLAAP